MPWSSLLSPYTASSGHQQLVQCGDIDASLGYLLHMMQVVCFWMGWSRAWRDLLTLCAVVLCALVMFFSRGLRVSGCLVFYICFFIFTSVSVLFYPPL